jgi:hypothetical protein
MNEHLTVKDLLLSLKYCRGDFGGSVCVGCPNAIPGTEDKYGMCKCRFNTTDEVIRLLESIIDKQEVNT